MNHKVIGKQHNSKMCLVCGLQNEFGLKAAFFNLENNEVAAIFRVMDQHQSYPQRLHGGIAGAILDETIGRAIKIIQEETWGVTVELNIKYKKPIPLDEELKAVGRITKDSSRLYEGTGEIILSNGEVAAIGYGKYLKMPLSKIADFDFQHNEWELVKMNSDPKWIEY